MKSTRLHHHSAVVMPIHQDAQRRVQPGMPDSSAGLGQGQRHQPLPVQQVVDADREIAHLKAGDVLKEVRALGRLDGRVGEVGLDDSPC